MKSLRWVGLVFSLLIVGVLGGLMALPTSGAVGATTPTITIKVDSMSGSTILATDTETFTLGDGLNSPTATSCPPGGPNYCYPLVTFESNATKGTVGPTGRQFKVMHAPNQTAKLNISDYKTVSNTSPSDTMVLTGVQFVPIVTAAGWPTTAKVRLTITVRNKFDAQPNPQANGSTSFYPFGMTIGGYFGSTPSPIGDISQMYAFGTFVTAGVGIISTTGQPKNISNSNNPDANLTVNPSGCTEGNTAKSPLCKTVASPGTTAQLTFTAGQNSTYYPGSPSSNPTGQRFACSNNAAAGSKSVVDPRGSTITYSDPSCQPDITEVHVFTLFGPDSVVLSSSSHSGGGVCGPNPLPACDCTDNKKKGNVCNSIEEFLDDQDAKTNALQAGITASVPCSTDICNGTLRTLIRVTPAPASTPPGNNVFPFIGAGPRVDNFEITTDANGNGELLPPFTNLITGRGGTALIISAGNFPTKDANSFWQVDQISCASSNGSTIPGVDFNTGPGGPVKGPVTIHAIGNGDTLTCLWHIHNEQNP